MITRQQALDCLASDDLIGIGLEADAIRRSLHPEGVVTYTTEPGEPSTAAITLGTEATREQLLDHLEAIRSQQAESPTYTAFTLETTAEPTAVEYLKTLAICRLYLDNIPNIQASPTIGTKVLQMTLRFGANDIGLILSAQKGASEEDLRRIIRDAGFQPAERDALYAAMYLS